MLSIIRTPVPCLPSASLPEEALALVRQARAEPCRSLWIVLTRRRRRALQRELVNQGKSQAVLLPRWHTLESLVGQALQYSRRQGMLISGPERLLRLGRAWFEVTGLPAGPALIRRLDRFVGDWQACLMPRPSPGHDALEKLVARYLHDLEADGRLDRLRSVALLVEELADPDSWPQRLFFHDIHTIVFDGFHRLEPIELQLAAALARKKDVLLWLVGTPESPSWHNVTAATAFLEQLGVEPKIVDFVPPPKTALAALGRQLFVDSFGSEESQGLPVSPNAKNPAGARCSPAGLTVLGIYQCEGQRPKDKEPRTKESLLSLALCPLAFLETPTPLAEVEAVARHIKAEHLRSAAAAICGIGFQSCRPHDQDWNPNPPISDRPLRLCDVAVVIPGPAYDPLIREVFGRHGLAYNLAGRALLLAQSRPARVILAALDLIRSQWRYEKLLDFLHMPLVKRRLEEAYLLYDLLALRPRVRHTLSHGHWLRAWESALQELRHQIDQWRNSALDLPENVAAGDSAAFLDRQAELAKSLENLRQSLVAVLVPVARLEEILLDPPAQGGLREMVNAVAELLQEVALENWLTPPATADVPGSAGVPPAPGERDARPPGDVPWSEYEMDQQAYFKLLAVLQTLAKLPDERVPLAQAEQPDLLAALQLALHGESYQIKAEDDAGVQVFEIREIRGLTFRRVYALGLNEGAVPPPPDEGVLGARRRQRPALEEQLRQREKENKYLFCQLFEAAEELLVLSRPTWADDGDALPSPFLLAVTEQVNVPPLEQPALATCLRDAAQCLGQTCRNGRWDKPLAELWPAAAGDENMQLLLQRVQTWHGRAGWPQRLQVGLPQWRQKLFGPEQPFSPSQLETYAACAFRFFGTYVLHLEERDADQAATQYGSVVHRVLQRWYAARRQGLADNQPAPPLRPEDRARLLELFHNQCQELVEGTLPPDWEALFVRGKGVLDFFLEVIRLLEEGDEAFGNVLAEFPLPPVQLGEDSQGRPVFLVGKVDRVDLSRSGLAQAIVLDYKTGRIVPPQDHQAKMADGRMLQLPLYGAALQQLFPHWQVIAGVYVHMPRRQSSAEKSSRYALAIAGPLQLAGPNHAIPFDTVAAVQKAVALAEGIRAGDFSLTPHVIGQPRPECTAFCPLRHACRQPEGYEPDTR